MAGILVVKPPIFVLCDNDDLLMFKSVDDAGGFLESPEVESGEYVAAFDAEGRRLILATGGRGTKSWAGETFELVQVRLKAAEEEASGSEELVRILLRNLPSGSSGEGLAGLVARAQRELKYV